MRSGRTENIRVAPTFITLSRHEESRKILAEIDEPIYGEIFSHQSHLNTTPQLHRIALIDRTLPNTIKWCNIGDSCPQA